MIRTCDSRHVVAGVLILCGLLSMGDSASATTWQVGGAGGGDFALIQDAVNAAAEGDTVLIAAGRYLDLADTGFYIDAYILVPHEQLTILGESPESVVIGPVVEDFSQFSPVVVYTENGSGTGVVLENLTLTNCVVGVDIDGGRVQVKNCRFENCPTGIDTWVAASLTVTGSIFSDGLGYGVRTDGGSGATVQGCAFSNCMTGVEVSGGAEARIVDCTFVGGVAGVDIAWCDQAEVRSCGFSGASDWGIVARGQATLGLFDNVIQDGRYNLGVYYYSQVTGTGNVFQGGSVASLLIQEGGAVTLTGNDILPGGSYSVSLGCCFPSDDWVIQHLENNFWGTTDPTQIDQWIQDSHDNATIRSEVSYLPFRGQTVPTERRTWDSLKSLYR